MVNSRYSGPPSDPHDRWADQGRRPGPYDARQHRSGPYSDPRDPRDLGAYGDSGQSGPQRSRGHRRHKRNGGRMAIAGAIAGVVAIAAIVGGIILSRGSGHGGSATSASGGDSSAIGGDLKRIDQPKTGTPLSIATPDGYAYTVAAIQGGTSDQPLVNGVSPAPTGQTFAYVDYVLTNAKQTPALLDFPADLFLKAAKVPDSEQAGCMPQPGVPGDMCTLRNHTIVTGLVGESKPPITQNGDQYMPAGASYRVRIQTDLPVDKGVNQADMGLYVWDIRFISNGKGVNVTFP